MSCDGGVTEKENASHSAKQTLLRPAYHRCMKTFMFLRVGVLCAALLMPRAWSQGLPELGDSSSTVFSPLFERRIGEQAMRDIRMYEPAFIDDPELTAYISRLGARLVSVSPDARQDFEFFFMRDPNINAFAMPGGFVGVNTGLVLASQTESEVASVLGHEVAHVTQRHIARNFGRMDQMSVVNIAAMVVAVLAAKGNSQVSQAAMTAASAGSLQAQINYTREFEREADRVGFNLLESAGFDVTAMPVFFERLQKAGRVYETGAPAYLRTHPLTIERISDMQNRIKDSHYKQTQDGPDFHFVKARLRAELGRPQEAVAAFEEQLSERRFTSESAAHYGLAFALNRAKQFARAESEINLVRKSAAFNPMVETLAARNKLESGSLAEATEILRAASARLPAYRPLQYAMVDLLQASGQHAAAVNLLLEQVKNHPREIKLHSLLSKSYAALGKRLLSHQSLAETYYLQGALVPAQEQLQLALKAGDGDFYAMSRIDARLREVRQRMAEEKRQR